MSLIPLWTIRGGANDGLQMRFRPDPRLLWIWIGLDRYAVRHHDHTLLLSPMDDDTVIAHKDHCAMMGISPEMAAAKGLMRWRQ